MKTTVRRSGSAAAQQHEGAIGAAPGRVAAAVPGRAAAPLQPRRTQAQRRAQAEQRLLDAALEIVARTGSVRMTLAQVGEAAGYSRGLAAHRFGSKAGLLRALAAHINARFVAQIPAASANLSGLAVIRRNIRVYFERTDRTWTTTRALLVMMTEGFMEGSAMRGDLAEYNRAALAALEKHIRIGIAAGEVRADVDPVTMPVILLGAMRGVMLQWLLDGDIDLLRVRDRMLELVDRTLAR